MLWRALHSGLSGLNHHQSSLGRLAWNHSLWTHFSPLMHYTKGCAYLLSRYYTTDECHLCTCIHGIHKWLNFLPVIVCVDKDGDLQASGAVCVMSNMWYRKYKDWMCLYGVAWIKELRPGIDNALMKNSRKGFGSGFG